MRLIQILAVCLVAVTCVRDGPVAPAASGPAATEMPVALLGVPESAALAQAVTDAQRWLLPEIEGTDTGTLAQRITAARRRLQVASSDESRDRLIEIDAMRLVLDGVEAVIQAQQNRSVP